MPNTGIRPKPNRLIICKGYDWSEFTCQGMWIPYKPGCSKKQKGKSRFCTKDKFGRWDADCKTWGNIETWEYADEVPEAVSDKEQEAAR